MGAGELEMSWFGFGSWGAWAITGSLCLAIGLDWGRVGLG